MWCTVAAALSLAAVATPLAAGTPTATEKVPITHVLDTDSRLRLDGSVNGSIDAAGSRMVTNASGAPRFLAALPPGADLDGPVSALAVSGSLLYVGGDFKTAGGVVVNNVARWDGQSWTALSTGTDGPVTALAVSGTTLYVGGEFVNAGSMQVNYIARWDGASWSGIGGGMDDVVNALAVSGTDLYAGGIFGSAGGVLVNCVARWNGTSWFALGDGVGGEVDALATVGADLYAGGVFATAGTVDVTGFARWNGTTWSGPGVVAPCPGDCNGDGEVTVDELITMVNIALGSAPLSACPAGDANGDGVITVADLIVGVNSALNGCPTQMPV